MSLKTSYRFIAPFYDLFVDHATRAARQRSLARLPQQVLPQQGAAKVLLNGVGTGLDFPYLPLCHEYTALDLTAAMLTRAQSRTTNLNMQYVRGDSTALPFAANCFDYLILHLIVAVVPQPALCLHEAVRVLKPSGRIFLFDKFLRIDERAWLRRALTPLVGQLATRLDVVFEEVMRAAPDLRVITDEPILARGWFRLIELQKLNRVC
ncbi:MAG: class I SAM-dependent methyltransferase [Candidatus Nitrotoga sp.]